MIGDSLASLSEAAVQAISTAVQGERMALDVEKVRSQAERLLVAAGIAALPPTGQVEALSLTTSDSRLAFVAAHAAGLVAAAELTAAIRSLQEQLTTGLEMTTWRNALAPTGNPVRKAQLQNAAEAYTPVSGMWHQGKYQSAYELLLKTAEAFPWVPSFVFDGSTDFYGQAVVTLKSWAAGETHHTTAGFWVDSIAHKLSAGDEVHPESSEAE